MAAADDTTLGWAQKLISAVQLSAAETGWSPQALAADPNVQVHCPSAMCAHMSLERQRWHTETCRCMLTGLDFAHRCFAAHHVRVTR